MPDPRQWSESKRLLIAAALGLAIWLVAGLLFAQPLPAGTSLDPRRALEISQGAVGRSIGDYTLIDSEGREVRLARFRGKPLVVSFVYTGCFQVCPTTTVFLGKAIAEAERVLGPATFNAITVGFNVPFDSPVAMRDFRKRQRIDRDGWTFAAGDAATIEALARDLGFTWMPTASGFDHVTQATLLDGRGRVVRQVYGDAFELPMFVGPLKELVTGAPAPMQNVADLLERVRILCTVYDPRAGKYRLNYALFIEIAAGLSVLAGTAWYLIASARRGGTRRRTAS